MADEPTPTDQPPAPKASSPLDNFQRTILVTEDDKFYANIYKMKFSMEGYDVMVANNGVEALEAARKKKPDLILLDLIMPIKDGFDTLRDLKADPKLKDIKVVVISNLGQPADIEEATKLGANGYLVKTDLSLYELVDKIRGYL